MSHNIIINDEWKEIVDTKIVIDGQWKTVDNIKIVVDNEWKDVYSSVGWLDGWSKRIKITIDKDKVDADLSNFPLPIYLSASSGQNNNDVTSIFDELSTVSGTKKIAVTTSNGTTQCYVEIEHWDWSNEKAWLHVKVPFVYSTSDTELYLYYDSTNSDNTTYVGDTGDVVVHNVWNSDFKRVWHLSQDPSSGAGSILDSTGNYNASPVNMESADLVDSLFGKGLNFDGVNERINIDNCGIDGANELTITVVHKPDVVPFSEYKGLFSRGSGGQRTPWMYGNSSLSSMSFYIETTDGVNQTVSTGNITTDYYVHDLVFGPGGNYAASNHLNENMVNITDWTDGDSVNGESTQVTFDSKSCMKLDTNTAATSNRAFRYRDVGSYGNRVILELSIYHEAVGDLWGDSDSFRIILSRNDVMLYMDLALQGIRIYDGAVYHEVGTDLVEEGVWQKWMFDCDFSTPASATVDVYLDDVLQEEGVDCSYTGSWVDGRIDLYQYGYTSNDRITYIDYVTIGDDIYTDKIAIYKDGVLIQEKGSSGDTVESTDGNNYIGDIVGYGNWDGIISEVRVMTSVISDAWSKATNEGFRDNLLTFG